MTTLSRFYHLIHAKLYPIRFHLLLCALLCVFVVNIFFPDNIYGGMAQMIYLPFQLLASFIIFERKRGLIYLMVFIALLLLVCRYANSFFAKDLQNELALLYICFFGGVFMEVMRQIYSSPLNSLQTILAAICGLLLIGYTGFYVFLAIELYQPGSFDNLSKSVGAINDLFYFSYITILTVGYGKITPVTWIAKNATVLIALIAYIYSWVVIATIVGGVSANYREKRSNRDKD